MDRAEDSVDRSLQRVKALLADKKWPEAIDTLSQVMEQSGSKLIAVTDRRFVSVRDYCHLQFVLLPPEALRLYRSRVDLQAKRLYEEGVALRDRRPLLTLLDQAFASTWGARALDALAEMALESGDPAAARAYWEKIVPLDQPADVPRTWLGVPDTDLDLAGIRARWCWPRFSKGRWAGRGMNWRGLPSRTRTHAAGSAGRRPTMRRR